MDRTTQAEMLLNHFVKIIESRCGRFLLTEVVSDAQKHMSTKFNPKYVQQAIKNLRKEISSDEVEYQRTQTAIGFLGMKFIVLSPYSNALSNNSQQRFNRDGLASNCGRRPTTMVVVTFEQMSSIVISFTISRSRVVTIPVMRVVCLFFVHLHRVKNSKPQN